MALLIIGRQTKRRIERMRKRRQGILSEPTRTHFESVQRRLAGQLKQLVLEEPELDRPLEMLIAQILLEDIEEQGFEKADYPCDPDELLKMVANVSAQWTVEKAQIHLYKDTPAEVYKALAKPDLIGRGTFRQLILIYLITDMRVQFKDWLATLRDQLQGLLLVELLKQPGRD